MVPNKLGVSFSILIVSLTAKKKTFPPCQPYHLKVVVMSSKNITSRNYGCFFKPKQIFLSYRGYNWVLRLKYLLHYLKGFSLCCNPIVFFLLYTFVRVKGSQRSSIPNLHNHFVPSLKKTFFTPDLKNPSFVDT